jgi:hypothetical protein
MAHVMATAARLLMGFGAHGSWLKMILLRQHYAQKSKTQSAVRRQRLHASMPRNIVGLYQPG